MKDNFNCLVEVNPSLNISVSDINGNVGLGTLVIILSFVLLVIIAIKSNK